MSKYLLTVDRCSLGFRGIFTSRNGDCFWKEETEGAHTEDEMGEILGPFDMVLSPKSVLMTEEEMSKYHLFIPLGEYSEVYGYVLTTEQYDEKRKKMEVSDETR